MVLLLRRLLVVSALMFWQGGFTFYAAVVVPVGQEVLGTHFKQGRITRRVTFYLNLAGAAALLPLAWDAAASADRSALRRRLRWLALGGMAAGQALLFWLHPQLDELIDLQMGYIPERRAFRIGHSWYLWISTVQWALGIVYALLTLHAWRDGDRATGSREAAALPSEPAGQG
jgi:hypothetical protein